MSFENPLSCANIAEVRARIVIDSHSVYLAALVMIASIAIFNAFFYFDPIITMQFLTKPLGAGFLFLVRAPHSVYFLVLVT